MNSITHTDKHTHFELNRLKCVHYSPNSFHAPFWPALWPTAWLPSPALPRPSGWLPFVPAVNGRIRGQGMGAVSPVPSLLCLPQWYLLTGSRGQHFVPPSFGPPHPLSISLSLFTALDSVPSSQYLHLYNLGWSIPYWNLIWYITQLSFCVYIIYVSFVYTWHIHELCTIF